MDVSSAPSLPCSRLYIARAYNLKVSPGWMPGDTSGSWILCDWCLYYTIGKSTWYILPAVVSHSQRILPCWRMPLSVFECLCYGIQSIKHMGIEHKSRHDSLIRDHNNRKAQSKPDLVTSVLSISFHLHSNQSKEVLLLC